MHGLWHIFWTPVFFLLGVPLYQPLCIRVRIWWHHSRHKETWNVSHVMAYCFYFRWTEISFNDAVTFLGLCPSYVKIVSLVFTCFHSSFQITSSQAQYIQFLLLLWYGIVMVRCYGVALKISKFLLQSIGLFSEPVLCVE